MASETITLIRQMPWPDPLWVLRGDHWAIPLPVGENIRCKPTNGVAKTGSVYLNVRQPVVVSDSLKAAKLFVVLSVLGWSGSSLSWPVGVSAREAGAPPPAWRRRRHL